MIITVGRQMGSGGLEIGKRVAEQLGLGFYDKELLLEAARESGICSDCFARIDEQVQTVYGGVGVFGMRFPFLSDPAGVQSPTLSADNLFLVQSETMQGIADKGNALFVGRCADYVLRERADLLSVFICASDEARVERIVNRMGCSTDEARNMMRRSDKQRAAYYDYFANRRWGAASSYHLCIDSSRMGIDNAVEMIMACAKRVMERVG